MKKCWLMLFIVLFMGVSNAIEVFGNQSGTWTADNNPYQVTGDVTVPPGTTLTVDPGVVVQAMGEYRINVEGIIIAQGTATDSISFYSADGSLWTGIRLDSVDEGSVFSHCIIEHAENGVNTLNTQVEITHCHFNNNEKGIHLYGLGNPAPPAVLIHANLIENCQQNGIMIVEHNPVITANEIRQCALDQSSRAGIQMSCQSGGGICQPQIIDNHIHNNVWQGITAWDIYASGDISPTVRGNLIEENLTGVYLYDASGYFENNVIRNNFVPGNANSGAGVMLYGATTYAVFSQNILTGNFTGFYIINGADADLGDQIQMTGRNLIYDNVDESWITHSVYSTSSQQITAQHCFWDSTDPAEIEQTINGSVDFTPLYTTEHTAVAFITGQVHGLVNPGVVAHLVGAEDRTVVATGYSTVDSTFFLPVPFAGDFFVHVIQTGTDDPLQGVYGGFDDPVALHIEEQSITTGIDITQFAEELPLVRTIEEPYMDGDVEVYPYRYAESIFVRQDCLLQDHADGVRITGFVDYSPGTAITVTPDQDCWLIPDNPQPGDTFTSARLNQDSAIDYLNADITPYGGEDELIIDYYSQSDGSLVCRRQFVLNSGIMGEKQYDAWSMAVDLQVDDSVVSGGEGFMPLFEGNQWRMSRNMDHAGPANLTAWPQQENHFLLMWDPPFPPDDGSTWEGYSIFQNDQLLFDLDFGEFWVDIEVPAGVNQYYVIAHGSSGDSAPSNTVTIENVSIDETQNPDPQDFLFAQIYPNPASVASGNGVFMNIASVHAPRVELYNIRGQIIRSWEPERSGDGRYVIHWNGRDKSGKKVASGIYFTRIENSRETMVKKLVLVH